MSIMLWVENALAVGKESLAAFLIRTAARKPNVFRSTIL